LIIYPAVENKSQYSVEIVNNNIVPRIGWVLKKAEFFESDNEIAQ
jgi:hypothetical protein